MCPRADVIQSQIFYQVSADLHCLQRRCWWPDHEICKNVFSQATLHSEKHSEWNTWTNKQASTRAWANANMQVHYGRASLAPVTSVPAYFVFPREPLDLPAIIARLLSALREAAQQSSDSGKRTIVVLPDQPYLWAVPALRASLNAQIAEVLNCHPSCSAVYGSQQNRQPREPFPDLIEQ